MTGPHNAFARECGPLLDDGIAEVPTAEYHPQIEFSERVRLGDVSIVVDSRDVLSSLRRCTSDCIGGSDRVGDC